MLPAHPQGLGAGGRLLLTRQALPAVFYLLTKTARTVSGKQRLRCFLSSHLFPFIPLGGVLLLIPIFGFAEN